MRRIKASLRRPGRGFFKNYRVGGREPPRFSGSILEGPVGKSEVFLLIDVQRKKLERGKLLALG